MKLAGRITIAASILCAAFGAIAPAQANEYPSKPITWITGYPPGGGVDFIARTVSKKMTEEMKQSFIIDTRSGAAGMIAATAIARAKPDGYTIASSGNGELVFNQFMYKNMNYDPAKDFASIGTVAKVPFLLAVGSALSVKTFDEFLKRARAEPLHYASGGLGHPNHLMTEMLMDKTGIKLTGVPYKGMAPALNGFLGGDVPVMFIDMATALSQMGSGRFNVLAVSTKERLPALPDLPTLDELGVKDFDVYAWQALVAPAGTPEAVISELNGALQNALNDKELRESFEKAGMQPLPGTPQQLDELVAADTKLWAPLVKSLNIQLD